MSFVSKFKYALVVGGVGLTMGSVSAYAGFDWTPPPQPPVVQQPVVQSPAPVADVPVMNGPLTPEPVADALPSVPSAPVSLVDTQVLPAEPVVAPVPAPQDLPIPGMKSLPVKPSVAAPSVAAPVSASPVLEGFGKDIPLALALRDIVPSQYAFAFESGEMAGRKVSWRGGKPWKDSLDDALASIGLASVVQGNAVMIVSQQKAPVPMYAPVKSLSEPDVAPITMTARRPDTAPPPVFAPTYPPTPAEPMAAPVAQKSALPVVDLTVVRKWQARPGMTLRDALAQWSQEASVELSWSTAYDYPINNAFYFEGNYGEAVDSLLSSYGSENPAPKGRLYPNLPDGPSVLMVN